MNPPKGHGFPETRTESVLGPEQQLFAGNLNKLLTIGHNGGYVQASPVNSASTYALHETPFSLVAGHMSTPGLVGRIDTLHLEVPDTVGNRRYYQARYAYPAGGTEPTHALLAELLRSDASSSKSTLTYFVDLRTGETRRRVVYHGEQGGESIEDPPSHELKAVADSMFVESRLNARLLTRQQIDTMYDMQSLRQTEKGIARRRAARRAAASRILGQLLFWRTPTDSVR